MKKRLLSCILMAMVGVVSVSAQGLPQDENVRKGVLPNGMTYYISHNAKDPKMAEFYIAQRVGSILEEPRQRGLAHFLEHMAFNGTKNFSGENGKPGLVQWCESVGIKFGRNLNAATGIDQTVYNISAAPVEREGVLDSCLLILHDWSNSLLLTDKEIDNERGVIHEEWRGGRANPTKRMWETVFPKMYVGTKYADCLPIGSIDVIDNFKYKDLRDYYHKWYRPDLQAIVVVGDLDADKVEAKIKKVFGDIPAPVNPAERIYYPVGDNEKMIVAIGKDKEQQNARFALYMKREMYPKDKKNTMDYFLDKTISSMVTSMLDDRLSELSIKENPPFVAAGSDDENFFLANTKRVFELYAFCREDNVKAGLEALVGEAERARQNGFTESELGRAKLEELSDLETAYNERNKRSNGEIVKECLGNFLSGEPMSSIEATYEMKKNAIEQVTLDQVNKYARVMISDKNQVLEGYMPEKEGVVIPTDAEFEKIILDAEAKTYEPYVDKLASTSLIENLRPAGKIVSEKKGKFGATEFKLSNGVKVSVKPTDFAANKIEMAAESRGGNSLYDDKDKINFALVNEIIGVGGLGQFDAVSIEKVLAGKNVTVKPYISDCIEGVNGSCATKDLKTMMQLIYLNFTAPRRDDVAYKSYLANKRSVLLNRDANTNVVFSDSCKKFLYGDVERIRPIKADMLDKVNYDRVLEIYKERFADASDFDFVFVGNVDIDSLRPLLETYIASLPSTNSKENFRDLGLDIRKVQEKNVFIRKQDTRSTCVSMVWAAPIDFNLKNNILTSVVSQSLRIVYTEKVREEKGGTYGVDVFATNYMMPKSRVEIEVDFRTDPEKYPELIPIIYEEMENLAKNGPSEDNLAKIKEYLVKNFKAAQRNNAYWKNIMMDNAFIAYDGNTNYINIVNSLTTKDVAKLAKKILANKCAIEMTMTTDELK